MPHTDTIPVSANVASTGLGIRYIGNYAYAYSGLVSSTSSGNELLNFTTGAGLIVARLQLNYAINQTDDMTYDVALNGTIVQQWQCTGSREPQQPQNTLHFIFPPFTQVIVSATSAGSAQDQAATITGRVYGAE